MFKEDWVKAYTTARQDMLGKIRDDSTKLINYASSKNIKASIDAESLLEQFERIFLPTMGLAPDKSKFEFNYNYIVGINSDGISKSIWELENSLTDFSDYYRVWKFYLSEYWNFVKKVFVNTILFSEHVAKMQGAKVEKIDIRESSNFTIVLTFSGAASAICYLACDLGMYAGSGFDDATKLTKNNILLYYRHIEFRGPSGRVSGKIEKVELRIGEQPIFDDSGVFTEFFGERLISYIKQILS